MYISTTKKKNLIVIGARCHSKRVCNFNYTLIAFSIYTRAVRLKSRLPDKQKLYQSEM